MHSSYVATLVHTREKERERLWASLGPIEPRPRSGKIADPSERDPRSLFLVSLLQPCFQRRSKISLRVVSLAKPEGHFTPHNDDRE